ncbi:MAG TPA: FecR domain-containing protein [Chitinophaga sp.]|uniref:FecR family protein n=1 Tax=Chitinophaga sp. TaxID=1869181 RepID=UPI002C73D83D|nr:FecR domain-containing protein [Chitinophaga sp.]HVI44123.1 FecR domain-containing protein [Chitinophaga sp.]
MQEPDQFQQLMDKYLTNSVSAGEKEQLFALIRQGDYRAGLAQMIDDALEMPADGEEDLALREEIFAQLQASRKPVRKLKPWPRIAAAAAVLLLLGAVYYYQVFKPVAVPGVRRVNFSQIKPGTDKAVLTLADGSTVALDSNAHQVIRQGAATVSQQQGQLVYNTPGHVVAASSNKLQTPRGGQFRLELPDGTLIWLNAASSVTYPTAFTGEERKITITGEVYLEVAPDEKPFIVSTLHEEVQVLGTQFNINAYEEETATRTTLLSGKIKVMNGAAGIVLKPGQQAVVKHQASSAIPVREVDAEQVIAWKNGYFDFENERLDAVLRLLSRWYNVDFDTDPAVAGLTFSAGIARSSTLEQVLTTLTATGAITFSDDGKKIKVYLSNTK